MMMHGLSVASGRDGHLQHSNEGVLENDFVTFGRYLDGVVPFGESRFVLGARQDYPGARGSQNRDPRPDGDASSPAHTQKHTSSHLSPPRRACNPFVTGLLPGGH